MIGSSDWLGGSVAVNAFDEARGCNYGSGLTSDDLDLPNRLERFSDVYESVELVSVNGPNKELSDMARRTANAVLKALDWGLLPREALNHHDMGCIKDAARGPVGPNDRRLVRLYKLKEEFTDRLRKLCLRHSDPDAKYEDILEYFPGSISDLMRQIRWSYPGIEGMSRSIDLFRKLSTDYAQIRGMYDARREGITDKYWRKCMTIPEFIAGKILEDEYDDCTVGDVLNKLDPLLTRLLTHKVKRLLHNVFTPRDNPVDDSLLENYAKWLVFVMIVSDNLTPDCRYLFFIKNKAFKGDSTNRFYIGDKPANPNASSIMYGRFRGLPGAIVGGSFIPYLECSQNQNGTFRYAPVSPM